MKEEQEPTRNAKQEAWRALYPFKSHYQTIGGFQYHYLDEGKASDKPVILCSHGNPTWSFIFRDLVKEFS